MFKFAAKILLVALPVLAVALWLNCPKQENEWVSIESARTLNMDKAHAWSNLRNLSLAHHYVPGIVRTEISSQQKTGVGASRRVYQSSDDYLNEEVIEWHEGRGFLLELYKDNGSAPFPFEQAQFRYELDVNSEGKTVIHTTLLFKMAGGCAGHWFGSLLAGEFQQRNDDVADGLKAYYESL